jgi:hypothetical protein
MMLLLFTLLLIGSRDVLESESSLTAGCGNLSCQIQSAKLSIWTTPFGSAASRAIHCCAGVELLCIAIKTTSSARFVEKRSKPVSTFRSVMLDAMGR